MSEQNKAKLAVFEGKQIRKVLHEGGWWFAIVDGVAALTDSINPSGYLKDMRRRDPSLAELFKGGGANCHPPCPAGSHRGRTPEDPLLEHRRDANRHPRHIAGEFQGVGGGPDKTAERSRQE